VSIGRWHSGHGLPLASARSAAAGRARACRPLGWLEDPNALRDLGRGITAAPLAGHAGRRQGHGSRIQVEPELTVAAIPRICALGDFADIPDPAGAPLPQLRPVALQSGRWAAMNILADIAGQPRTPFDDKHTGIMAMIGRNAAVAEVGTRHHELHGSLAFAG